MLAPSAILLVCGAGSDATNAVVDHAHRLRDALATGGMPTAVRVVSPPHRDGALLAAAPGTAIVIEYTPYAFGRRGVAPGLVWAIARARRARPRHPIVIVCHETMTDWPGLRPWTLRQVQRLQLAALLRLSDARYVAIEPWQAPITSLGGGRAVGVIPIGSNLPDARSRRAAVRETLGVSGDLVVLTMSTGHPTFAADHARRAVRAICKRSPGPITLLSVGAGRAPLVDWAHGPREIVPGWLELDELAGFVAAADLMLNPLVDGLSTRRGSFMAALQHGVAVVGTDGRSTSDALRQSGAYAAVPAGDPDAYAGLAADVAGDHERRSLLGARGRALYETHFDWHVVAEGLRQGIRELAE